MLSPEALTLAEAKVPRYTSYPTAPHFSPAIGPAHASRWMEAIDDTQPVSIYIHVPFCEKLCWYCGCNTSIASKYGPVHHYFQTLLKEIALARRAIGRTLRAGHVHLGGGTPNALNAADLASLARVLRESFRFDSDTRFEIEIDPRTLDDAQIKALKEAGVTRANLGIQDFDARVQAAINRIQPFELVAAKLAELRKAGIAQIGMDLIYGLPHQSAETIEATIDQSAELGAERIALFGYAHVPWMKPHQKLLEPEGLPGMRERMVLVEAAHRRLDARGYTRIGIDHFAYPDDEMARAHREGRLRRNFQGYTTDMADALIGFGPSAISAYAQGYAQNHARLDHWREAIERDLVPVVRGIQISREDRLRRAVVERLMCDMEVDLDAVCRSHGAASHALDHFRDELGRLDFMVRSGLVTIDGTKLAIPAAAQNFVRVVASIFDQYIENGKAKHSVAV